MNSSSPASPATCSDLVNFLNQIEVKLPSQFQFLETNIAGSACISDVSIPEEPIVFVNDIFLNQTGFNREEVVGKKCNFLQGPDTSLTAIQNVRKLISNRQAGVITLQNYTKEKKEFTNQLFLCPLISNSNSDTEVRYMLGNHNKQAQTKKNKVKRVRFLIISLSLCFLFFLIPFLYIIYVRLSIRSYGGLFCSQRVSTYQKPSRQKPLFPILYSAQSRYRPRGQIQ